ncbi:MAG: HYC_CC_PP family protein [Lutibacter sp.]
MKQLFRKISAIIMASVVLLSTMSFTISEHFCGRTLVDSALFSKAESCGMEMEKPSPTNDCELKKSDCCKDEIKQFQGQNELNTDFSTLNFQQQVFIASFAYSYVNLFEGLAVNIIPFKHYTPPLLIADIQVLDQTFLI